MRTAVWIVAVVLALGGFWWALSGDDARREHQPLPADEPDEAAREPAPTLTASGQAPPSSEPVPIEVPGTPQPATGTRHHLAGELVGLDPEVEGAAVITVAGLTADYRPPPARPTVEARRDGTFSLDVTDVFAGEHTVVDLEVSVEHPGYMPARTQVPVTSGTSKGHEHRYHVRIPLTRAGFLVGRVETERGDPVPAKVGAFFLEDGRPQRGCKASAECDEEGRYRLRVGKRGRYLVAAVASTMSQPAAAEADVVPGSEAEIPALVMRPGVAVRGEVRFRGARLAGAEVRAAPKRPDATWLSMPGARLVWTETGLLHGKAVVTADENGRFAVGGLRPGAYRIQVSDAPDTLMHMACGRDSRQVVDAPATDVVLTLAGCEITLAIVKGGRPLANPNLMIHGRGGSMSCTLNASGEIVLLMPAGETYYVSVWGDGLPQRDLTLEAPADQATHREVIELGTEAAKPQLVVTLAAPGEAQVMLAGFGFFKPSARWAFDRRDVKAKDGRFVIERLQPGTYVMKVRAGGAWWGGHGHYLQESRTVTVPEEGEAEIRLALRPGGRLRIVARNPEGDVVAAPCTIRDAAGAEMAVSYVTRTEHGLTSSGGSLGGQVGSNVDPALPAGTYEIALAHKDYFPKRLTVEVVAGQTKDVEIALQPTR